MISAVTNRLRLLFRREQPAVLSMPRATKAAALPAKAPPLAVPLPPEPSVNKRGRPVADALTRTVEILTKDPEISSAALADSLQLSRSYARTLLRRARTRVQQAPKPAKPPKAAAISVPLPAPAPETRKQI